MNSSASEQWLQMALDVVTAAQDGMTVQEYDRRAKLIQYQAGAGYIDRMRVLDRLIEDRIVGLDDRTLTLGSIDGVDWIISGLQHGNQLTWTISEAVDRHRRVIRKFDSDALEEIGRIGEDAVIKRLAELLPTEECASVRHVSLNDDTLGFDIVAPSTRKSDEVQLLEVKTTVRPGVNFPFFISRNEFRVGVNNSNWSLVCVRIIDGEPVILGHLRLSQVAELFPVDTDDSVKWASCQVLAPSEILLDGLP